MKVTLVQLNSTDDLKTNIQQIKKIISTHLEKSESIFFVLPENSLYFRIIEGSSVKAIALNSAEVIELQNFCDLKKISLHFTTAVSDSGHIWNASILLRPQSKAELVYKKVHLFDIALDGQKAIRESDQFKHGELVTSFQIGDIKFGSSICYDIRFAELYSQHAKNAVDVILVPSAFLVKTGQAHWEVLLRARAIESQAYILAPAQAGEHHSVNAPAGTTILSRSTFGHSMAVDPWGTVLLTKASDIGCVDIDIDLNKIKSVRQQIPMAAHRRL